ncbi:MAG: flagellar basal-body MS-ring/collar protein FliF [Bryobacteraceae bacterium]
MMDQLWQLLQQLTLQQRILIVVVACLVAGGIFLGVHWNRERDLRPLFTSLASEDAGAVVEKLKTANVDYKVADNGAVMVPSARVAELRLEMAAAGLPRSGRLGFELFDKQNLGSTEFDDQVRLRRAIEGELERSVMTLTGVEAARVHVTFTKDSVFSDLRQPAKASVLIRLRPGAHLTAQNVAAIQHLAASAVEALQPESVTVVDMNGNLLGKPRGPLDTDAGSSSAMLDYRQALEHDLLVKIRSTLDPLLGAERYRAGVTAECDMTSGDQSEETFDPDHSVMVSSQKTEESNGYSSGSGGVPGTSSNLPRPVPPSPGGRGAVTRKTENIAYQTSRVVKHVKLPQGGVKRLSVAVLVDQGVRWEGVGPSAKRVLDPPSADTLRVVKDVVSGVIGFQPARGDQVLVETLPFDATLALPAPEPLAPAAPPGGQKPPGGLDLMTLRLRSLSPLWLGAGAGLLVVLLVAVGVLLRRRLGRRNQPLGAASAGVPLLAPGAASAAQPGSSKGEFEAKALAQLAENRQAQEQAELDALQSLKLVPTTRKAEVFKRFILEEAKKDPGKMAQLLRAWLSGEAV